MSEWRIRIFISRTFSFSSHWHSNFTYSRPTAIKNYMISSQLLFVLESSALNNEWMNDLISQRCCSSSSRLLLAAAAAADVAGRARRPDARLQLSLRLLFIVVRSVLKVNVFIISFRIWRKSRDLEAILTDWKVFGQIPSYTSHLRSVPPSNTEANRH